MALGYGGPWLWWTLAMVNPNRQPDGKCQFLTVGKYSVLSVGFPTCRHGLIYVRKNLNPVGSLNKSKMNSNATNKFITASNYLWT